VKERQLAWNTSSVFNEGPNGQSFYEKLGFILDDQWGNFVIREMRYRKPL
jgi:hypothetical protein